MQRETRIAHYVVGALTTLSLVLLSLPLSSPVRSFKAGAAYVFDPVAYEGEKGVQKLAGAPESIRGLLTADVENRRLEDELRRMAWLKADSESLARENERLRRALGLKLPPARHPIWAHVTYRNPQRWYAAVVIDAGADRGVSLNDPVLARQADSLAAVGRVVEVRPRSSVVMLLTDSRSAAAAYLSSGTYEGLIQGQDGPRLRMNYVNSEAKIAADDSVFTSATSVTFPPDILVGRVSQVNPRDPFLALQSADVVPALDGAALQEVLILRARAMPGEKAPAPLPLPGPAETARRPGRPEPAAAHATPPALSTSTATSDEAPPDEAPVDPADAEAPQ